MADFPSSINISSVKISREENLIRSESENGVKRFRRRTTKTRKRLVIKPTIMNSTDRDALLAHYDANEQYESFNFTHPIDATVYTVRYEKPLEYSQVANAVNLYSFNEITLMEV